MAAVATKVVSHNEWLDARKALLEKEKELTRARDAVNEQRRALPMEPVSKPYKFVDSSDKSSVASLADLFKGRKQLIVYHFMFGPESETGCPQCAYVADNVPHLSHLNSRDTTFVMVSRAPAAKLAALKTKMGWENIPWFSSAESDFNYDFYATQDEDRQPVYANYMDKATLVEKGLNQFLKGEVSGISVFVKDDAGNVLHSYSTFMRGVEPLMPTYGLLDLTPLGRQDGTPWKTFKRHYDY